MLFLHHLQTYRGSNAKISVHVKISRILAESEEAGLFLAMAQGGRKIFVMGHPEYDRVTLDGEYKRDVGKGLQIDLPKNYYKDNDPENRPLLLWRAHANNLYTNC